MTAWKAQGADDREIAELLGHAPDSKQTRVYAQIADGAKIDVVRGGKR